MSKYARLADYLRKESGSKKLPVTMSFRDLEGVLGFKLPHSAYKQRAWWSNNVHNNVMTRVWRSAGFRTEQVDMAKEKVVFQNVKEPLLQAVERELNGQEAKRNAYQPKAGFAEERRAFRSKAPGGRHPLRGALKGTLRLVGGTDLTKPAGPNWGRN